MVRRAELADLDALFPIARDFATSFTPQYDSFATSFRELLAREDTWLGVALAEGRVIGYALGSDHLAFYANGRVSWVEEIAVIGELRRKGVGRALMDHFERWARSRGSRLVGLATRRAAAFYGTLGYEESATFFRKLL